MSFYLKVRLLVLLLSYGVRWESPGHHLAGKFLARSSKVRLIVLLSNRITSGIHALNFDKNWLSSDNIV